MSGLKTAYPDLLPPNAVPLEKALAGPTGRIDNDIPVPIDKLLDAWECPVAYLPWLAWHLSLDLWDWEWDEFKQRSVIAKAIILARSKGTAHGMRLHCDVVDTEVKQLVVPPQGVFASAAISKDDYDAWLRTMPQIRVFLARETGSAKGLQFLALDNASLSPALVEHATPFDAFLISDPPTKVAQDPLSGLSGFSGVSGGLSGLSGISPFLEDDTRVPGQAFASFDAGRAIFGRKARLWDRGVETPLFMWDLHTEKQLANGVRIERVSIPGKVVRRSLFCSKDGGAGGFVSDGVTGASYFSDVFITEAKVVTYRQDITYEHSVSDLSMLSAHPGLDPVDVRSERITLTGNASQCAFDGRFITERPALSGQGTPSIFACKDDALNMIFDRIVLHDPKRAAPRVQTWSFLNFSRLGFADFTCKAIIDLKDKLHRSSMADGLFLSRGWYWRDRDTKKEDRARRAVRVSKAARDRILTTHKLTRKLTFGDTIPLDGSVSLIQGNRVPFRL